MDPIFNKDRELLIETKDGISMTVGDVITSILDFYHTHPYISYGGLDAVQEYSDSFEFTVYAGI